MDKRQRKRKRKRETERRVKGEAEQLGAAVEGGWEGGKGGQKQNCPPVQVCERRGEANEGEGKYRREERLRTREKKSLECKPPIRSDRQTVKRDRHRQTDREERQTQTDREGRQTQTDSEER